MTVPSTRTYALGTGAFLGLYANLRYQLLCGIDRGLSNYFDAIGVSLFFSTALRSGFSLESNLPPPCSSPHQKKKEKRIIPLLCICFLFYLSLFWYSVPSSCSVSFGLEVSRFIEKNLGGQKDLRKEK